MQQCFFMKIRRKDYEYLENLAAGLDPAAREWLRANLVAEAAGRSGVKDFGKITIVEEDVEAADPREWITRTVIQKAYKAAKGG